MAVSEIRSHIIAIEKDALLRDERNFDKRIEVIDFIEFQIIDRIDALLQKSDQTELTTLKFRAERLKDQLEEIDNVLFEKLCEDIRTGICSRKGFKELISEYADLNSYNGEDEGYDNLDIFINGLFSLPEMPGQTKDLEPDMVFYQKTPARIIFEMVEKIPFNKEDVFFDLGSGLGQVAMLVNLLTGVSTKGVEFEPAFCEYANTCAERLNLPDTTFINTDARTADYSNGTVFFMYTPFRGEMLKEVLDRLKTESMARTIRIITYGPCTAQVALQDWLKFAPPQDASIYKPGIFSSR